LTGGPFGVLGSGTSSENKKPPAKQQLGLLVGLKFWKIFCKGSDKTLRGIADRLKGAAKLKNRVSNIRPDGVTVSGYFQTVDATKKMP